MVILHRGSSIFWLVVGWWDKIFTTFGNRQNGTYYKSNYLKTKVLPLLVIDKMELSFRQLRMVVIRSGL